MDSLKEVFTPTGIFVLGAIGALVLSRILPPSSLGFLCFWAWLVLCFGGYLLLYQNEIGDAD